MVEDFSGPASGRVRSQLVANLQRQDDIELVSRSEVRAAARRLRLRGRSYTEDQYAELAAELSVAAFIDGRTSRRRRRWAATIRVRNGADGMMLGSESWGGRTMGALNAIRRNGHARLEPYLEAAVAPGGSARPAQQQQQQQASASVGTQASAEGGTPWYARGQDAEVPPGGDEEEEDEEEDLDPVAASDRQVAFRIGLLAGTLHRSMSARAVVVNNCMDPTHPSCRDPSDPSTTLPEDRTYTSGFPGHPELGLEVELYPGALADDQPVPWFGIVGSYRHSLFLSSSGPSRDGSEIIDVPTTESELYIGARGRYRFGDNPGGLEGMADIGYGNFNFTLDPAALKQLHATAVVPPIDYRYLLIGASLSYGFDPVYARAGIEVDYRLGLGVGKDAKEIWGTQTSDTSGFGVGAFLHSEAPYVGNGFFWRLEMQYFRFSTVFRGQTACVDPDFDGNPGNCSERDPWEIWPYEGWDTSDPMDNDPDSVTGGIIDPVGDGYIRLGIVFGYQLR